MKTATRNSIRILAGTALLYIALTFINNVYLQYAFFLLLLIVMEVDVIGELKRKLPFGKAVVSAVLFVVLSALIGRIFPSNNLPSDMTLMKAVSAIIFAPICEELFFRKMMNEGVPDIVGAVFSSAVFGIFHGVDMFIPASLAGLVLFVIFRLTGSLKASIFAHSLNNALAVMLHPETIEYFSRLAEQI